MKRLIAVLGSVLMLAAVAPASTAAPSQGGLASDNVEFLQFVPFEVGTATGARVIGKYLYVTSWKSFSIYDISDPANPARLSTKAYPEDASSAASPFRFENEDVATNGKIMIFSEELPQSRLHIWDVEDKANPEEIAVLNGAGQHTMSCLQNCKWLYGSDGYIVDLRSNPGGLLDQAVGLVPGDDVPVVERPTEEARRAHHGRSLHEPAGLRRSARRDAPRPAQVVGRLVEGDGHHLQRP